MSVYLAYVDKIAKHNRGVKYLLLAVDSLSRYLKVEPLKMKYATETAQNFKKMIKQRQTEDVWVADGREFLGSFEAISTERWIHLYSTFSEKKSAFAKKIYVLWRKNLQIPRRKFGLFIPRQIGCVC